MSATLVSSVRGILAIGNVTAQVGPVYSLNRGFVSPPLRNGAGDYTLTLQDGANLQSEAQVAGQVYGVGDSTLNIEILTVTTFRVRTFTGGVAAELNFGVAIQDVGPS